MRIAIQNCWPNVSTGNDKTFVDHALIAARRLGWDAAVTVTSNDILDFAPDCVLITDDLQPKLTPYPTIGISWTPCRALARDSLRQRNILSYDGVIPGSAHQARFLRDLIFAADKDLPVAEFIVHPAPPTLERPDAKDAAAFGLSGDRATPRLCLHDSGRRADGLPSPAFWAAAAAGALIIVDDFDFPRHVFRDTVLYVDPKLPPDGLTRRIAGHTAWAKANPAAAAARAGRAKLIFENKFALEKQLTALPAFLDVVRQRGGFIPHSSSRNRDSETKPQVEFIVRIGARPVSMIERCLESLAAQTAGPVGVLLAQFHPVEGLEEVIDRWRPRFAAIRRIQAPNTGLRSTALWAGLRAVKAPFFGVHDDDDTIHPNHVASLLAGFKQDPSADLIYSGAIRVEETPGIYFHQPNFSGDLSNNIAENRRIEFLESFCANRIFNFDNYILSHSWLARRSILNDSVLDDPDMEVGEDLYFYHLLIDKIKFKTTLRPTAEWRWRSAARSDPTTSNSMLSVSQDNWSRDIARIRNRRRFAAPPPSSCPPAISRRVAMEVGQTIDFRRPETAGSLLCGFSPPEADGAWTENTTAWLELAVSPGMPRGVLMEICFIPVVTPHNGHVIIDIQVNNRSLDIRRYDVWRETMASCIIPDDLLQGDRLLIGFIIRNTFNPSRYGVSNDDRELGLLLKSISFQIESILGKKAGNENR